MNRSILPVWELVPDEDLHQDGELKDVQSDINYKVNLGYYKLHNEEVYRRSDVSLMELEWMAETYE